MTKRRLLSTLQRILGAVKQPSDASAPPSRPLSRPPARRRLFEGSGAALIGVSFAAAAAFLAAPRATKPLILPLPEPHRAVLARDRAAERARAERAKREELPYATRAVGETLRRFGVASASRGGNAEATLKDLRALAQAEHSVGHSENLLALRAVQTELFVAATRGWERSGKVDAELRELGGDFPELAERSGWLEDRRVTLEDEELALLFRMRWNDLTGLGATQPFTARLDEYRDRYALLLRHPSGENAAVRLKRQLGYVAAMESLDHDYPAMFARGVLLYRAEAYEAAANAFRAHLETRPNGPWTLRAKNHLLEATSLISEER